ncbi:MAG TPA: choice-of-anchor D domain-containing protein [Mycobacteriales bacterium]|nr:choice-of-anchor D domain-containing protein [Mycobacteriales bacterium]
MLRRLLLSLAAISVVVVAVALPVGRATASSASSDTAGSTLGDTTISVNDLRDGWDQDEPQLSPSIVGSSDFGQLFSTQVDGQVYAAPLVVDRTDTSPGILIVATENNDVYGLNPVDGSIEWGPINLGTPWSASVLGCGDLTPNLGVTSTPVFDPSTDTVYVMAKDAPDGATSTDPRFQLHALDAQTGVERTGWPVTISGHPDNDPTRTFNPETAAQRPGLLLLNGVIYAGFASHCDYGPYVGYVVGVSTSTATRTAMFSTEAGSDNGEGGIWQGGGGLVSDGDNQIIVSTGNGNTAPVAPSDAPPADLSEAVVRLQVQSDGTLKPTDWFSPANGASLNQTDSDLGSGGPLAIPDGYGTSSYPHLLVQAGKDGRVFLLNRDELGGEAQGPGGTDDVLNMIQLGHGQWGHPAFWGGTPDTDSAGGYVYIDPSESSLQALKLTANGSGTPQLVATATSANIFHYTSGSPIVTSDGTTAGSALVWVVSVHDSSGAQPMLYAYNAEPDNGVLDKVYSAPLDPPGVANTDARGVKFTTVATDNGRVFVGTRDGYVFGFGHPSGSPVYAPHTDFGPVPVGTSSSTVAVTLTASRPVEVTGVSTNAPFHLVDTTPALPVTLDTNDTMTVDLTMTPTVPGDQSGTLTVDTAEAGGAITGTVDFGLSGYGTSPGLVANPSFVDFGTVPIPGYASEGVNLVNTSGEDETISSVTPLSAPFSSTDLQSLVGQVLPAGASIAVPLVYSPTIASTNDAATLTISVTSQDNPDPVPVSIPLSGAAIVGAPKLVRKPRTLDFGPVAQGASRTLTFQIYNAGNVLLKIDKAKAPFGQFYAALPVDEGATIQPDQAIVQSVTFAPTKKGTSTATYEVTGNDSSGAQYEQLVGLDDQLTDRYNRDQALQSQLGKPHGPTTKVGGGYERLFAHGEMFWSTKGGIRALTRPILTKYLALGGPSAAIGYPSSNVVALSPKGHRVRFVSGWSIYSSKRSGAWSVHGRTGTKWIKLGAQHSSLGFPTSDPKAIAGGTKQTFEHGSITWTRAHGYVVTHT